MSSQEYKTAYVMVHLPTQQPDPVFFISPIPFTEAKLAPGGKIQIDKICSTYSDRNVVCRRLLTSE